MKRWASGDVVAAASGLVALVAAVSPWAVRESTGAWLSAFALGEVTMFATVLFVGAALIAIGLSRSSWTGLVALVSALVLALALFSGAIPVHRTGVRPSFGFFALSVAASLSVLGGVLNAVEREGEWF